MVSQDFLNFVGILKENPEFPKIKINGSTITYQGKSLDLSNFNLSHFFAQNPNFYNDLPTLSIKAIYDILKLHVLFESQSLVTKTAPQDIIEQASSKFPVLKNFHIITNETQGNNKTYVYYVDQNGISHIIPNLNAESLIMAYHDLVINKNSPVTSEELFNYLNYQVKELKLESLADAKMRDHTSEEHKNNLEMLNNRNYATGNTLETALGNEEERIYINEQKVQTLDLNSDYQIVKNSHEVKDSSDEISEEQIVEEEIIDIMSFEEYQNLILKETDLNYTKDNQIKVYESFLLDVITYKNYLTPELYQIYQKFSYLFNYLYQVEKPTQIMVDAIKRYEDMLERSEKVNLTNSLSKVAKLTRMNKDYKMAGYLSIYIYLIAIIILIGIILGLYLLVS